MVNQTQVALSDAAEWLGVWHPLSEQLGSASGLVTLASVSAMLDLEPVHSVATLRRFISRYHAQILVSVEWPAIRQAHYYADRNGLRELVALDQQLEGMPVFRRFSAPSQRVGQAQLQKLAPLRDQRLVQRYLAAVAGGQARGWHMLVYGLTLSVYSLPLRQGLLGYAHQTTRGFIYSAAPMLRLSERECRWIFDTTCGSLPSAMELLLHLAPESSPVESPED